MKPILLSLLLLSAASSGGNETQGVPGTLFRGRVTHRGEPVEGVLNLKPAGAEDGRTAVANLGADGRFQVQLERKGAYTVFVHERTSRSTVSLRRPVMFDDPAKEIEIELPAGRIRGRVVDSNGGALGQVRVTARRRNARLLATAGAQVEADGRFTIGYVAPGTWELVAESPDTRSEPVTVSVPEGDLDGVTLVVEAIASVHVRVVDSGGSPVARALVTAELRDPEVRPTDERGTAVFRLSPSQRSGLVNLYVSAPPDGRLSCVRRTLDADQTITLGTAFGGLRLVRANFPREAIARLVSESGCSIPLLGGEVANSSSVRKEVSIRRLAAGEWSYVETGSAADGVTPLATFTIKPRLTTRISLPAASH